MKDEKDYFVKRSDGTEVSPIVVINEQYGTSVKYEETIANKNDRIFQTTLKINGVLKASALSYSAKISKIQAAFIFCTEKSSMSGLEQNLKLVKLGSPSRHQTDNNSGIGSFNQPDEVIVDQLDLPQYNKESYSITGKKVCMVLVISKFNDNTHDRMYTENDHKQAKEVLERRGFQVILMVGRVTKNDFTKKLKDIKKRTDIGLFMLVVSSHGDEHDNVMFSDNDNWSNVKSRCVFPKYYFGLDWYRLVSDNRP